MLDPESRMPLYYQLEMALRREIESGVWQAHGVIPPERELIEHYGVSRITVRQALQNLVAQGLLYRRHGKGTYVAEVRSGRITESLAEMTGHLEELQLRGLDPQVDVLALEIRPLPAEVGAALQRPPGSEGWYLYRLVTVDTQPLMLSTVWLPCDLKITLTEEVLRQNGMARLLTAHGHVPDKGVQRIGACGTTPEESHLLSIKSGDAVLRVTRVISGAGDLPLVWFLTLYRADRYEYEVELKRRRS
ncbi:MAG TPA: GntR family transcriptional regulator [Symbiobacteriaceae bacterium]